jgi:hypothetical protein
MLPSSATLECLRFLIFNSLGASPLHDASKSGHLHVVQALLGAKANLNDQDMYVCSFDPFFCCCATNDSATSP